MSRDVAAADLLVRTGSTLLLAVLGLVVALGVLPGHGRFVTATISSAAYGPQAGVVFGVLLLFGLATAAFGAALGLRLGGRAGVLCGSLVGAWAVASVFDAFVRTATTHVGTAFGQVHTLAAVAGIVAQGVVAIAVPLVLRRRNRPVPGAVRATTAVVLAGVVFVAVHPDVVAGLSERLLFAASGAWMLVTTRSLRPGARGRRRAGVRVPVATRPV